MQLPKKRSKCRILVGKIYFIFKKNCYWYFSRTDFANKLDSTFLPYTIFTHRTVTLRRLQNVDMWMQYNKVENLKIATRKLNGLTIEPGQTFSYWRQIGNPTQAKGYKKGMVLDRGKVKAGIGGGLCQLSNLIYWMSLHSPLDVIERWRHSYDVFPDVRRTQPFGTGATCAYPNIDLQLKNNTKQKFQLQIKISDRYLIGKWLSDCPIKFQYEIIEKEHFFQSTWWGGYSRNNKIFRKVLDKDSKVELDEKLITENQAIMMYSPFLKDQPKQ